MDLICSSEAFAQTCGVPGSLSVIKAKRDRLYQILKNSEIHVGKILLLIQIAMLMTDFVMKNVGFNYKGMQNGSTFHSNPRLLDPTVYDSYGT